MKVIFFGTPEYAVPVLQQLINSHHQVTAVVSQPDKAKGRSNKIVPTPIKALAMQYDIPVFQYEKIRKDDVSEMLSIDADVIVTCAYGQIIGSNVLFAKKFGVINLHGSILPKYRGSSPIQWALINNEKETGVTVLRSDVGMDDGEVMMTRKIAIADDDNAITLFDKLSKLSADVAVEALDILESGKANFVKQDESLATACKMLKPEMGDLDFNNSSLNIVGLIKGLASWPNAHITIDGVYFKLYNARVYGDSIDSSAKPGQVLIANNKEGLIIRTGDGAVEITELLPINSKKMSAKSYLNGKKINIGSIVQ